MYAQCLYSFGEDAACFNTRLTAPQTVSNRLSNSDLHADHDMCLFLCVHGVQTFGGTRCLVPNASSSCPVVVTSQRVLIMNDPMRRARRAVSVS